MQLLKTYNTNNALVQLAACKLENHSFLVQYAEVDMWLNNVLVYHLLQKCMKEVLTQTVISQVSCNRNHAGLICGHEQHLH